MKALPLLIAACTLSCASGGNTWMNQPLSTGAWEPNDPPPKADNVPGLDEEGGKRTPHLHSRALGQPALPDAPVTAPGPASTPAPPTSGGKSSLNIEGGRVLGTFRNTYYDLPNESDYSGDTVALKNARCKTIKDVARSFYEDVCVQGSGTLSSGSTVSFAKRDCDCAPLCPRTDQHICFDELDAKTYPWGRGATGRAITPLLTVAVDTDVVPLDTAIYIPEFDGVPRDPARNALHDGCFIAQDRGVRVKGDHIDVFTGHRDLTTLWNGLVPSNRGVTIVLDSPRCARAKATL
ncbi:MAG TPA: 3D domain-containing protein [Polyangiaceae bacterium]|nr:3D domain-containing protein [Polyangiaceae bacterium]